MSSLWGSWTSSISTGGCVNIPFSFLKPSTCSTRSRSLATSALLLLISFDNEPLSKLFLHFPSFFFRIRYSWDYMGEPTFQLSACMINVWTCNLYDELALRGVTHDRNSCMMKQESWFLPKLYNENFLSDGNCATHRSWVQDASRRVCPDANKNSTYHLRMDSIHYMNMDRFFTWSEKGLISAQWRSS